jgi:ankyrin repeat protein
MKKQQRKQAVLVLAVLALSGLISAGCLQAKGGHAQSNVKIETHIGHVDPVQWYETVRWQSTGAVKALLESGADPDQIFFNGESALHLAVEQGNYEMMELLLAYGADVNIQERKDGFTPLMYAAIKDDRKLLKLLTSHGADPTVADVDGYTTYHYLAARNNLAATKLVAGAGPVPEDLSTKDGLTVADIASLGKRTTRMTVAFAEQLQSVKEV